MNGQKVFQHLLEIWSWYKFFLCFKRVKDVYFKLFRVICKRIVKVYITNKLWSGNICNYYFKKKLQSKVIYMKREKRSIQDTNSKTENTCDLNPSISAGKLNRKYIKMQRLSALKMKTKHKRDSKI